MGIKIAFKENPLGRDLLGFTLDVDTKWLAKEMLRTGKSPAVCISDHLVEGIRKELLYANKINRMYAKEFV